MGVHDCHASQLVNRLLSHEIDVRQFFKEADKLPDHDRQCLGDLIRQHYDEARRHMERDSPQPQTKEELPERRREPRYPTREPVEVEGALGKGQRLAGFVLDVSRSGLQLELKSPIGKGTKIKITFPAQIIVFGDVRYCRSEGTVFQAGVLIEKVLYSSHAADRHLQNAELNLLISGEGLTAAKLIELRKHLIHCKACESRLERATGAQSTSTKKK
jgi:hypothetical protein